MIYFSEEEKEIIKLYKENNLKNLILKLENSIEHYTDNDFDLDVKEIILNLINKLYIINTKDFENLDLTTSFS